MHELCLNFDPFPRIKSSRLFLTEVEEKDVHELFFLRSDPSVMTYLDKEPAKNLNEILAHIKRLHDMKVSHIGLNWGLRLEENGKLIGCCGIWQFDKTHHRASIGYVLHPDYQGKGLMSEAVNAIVEKAFDDFNFHSIEANINPANDKSRTLLERAGFKQEGHYKDRFYFKGKYLDTAIYTILNPNH